MNIHAPIPAAQRYRMTFADVRMLAEAGSLDPDAKYELIDGVLYQMPAEGYPHVRHKSRIAVQLSRLIDPAAFSVIPDSTMLLSAHNAPSPDLYVFPARYREEDLTGDRVSLVVEVADTSVGFDTTDKARLYAGHGVRDYWVVDIEAKVTHVFRGPAEDGTWAERVEVPFAEPLRALLIPDLSLTIADLPRLGG